MSPHTAADREAWVEANHACLSIIRDESTHLPIGWSVWSEDLGWSATAHTLAEAVDLAMAATKGVAK